MKILHIDENHPLMIEQLSHSGFENEQAYTQTKEQIMEQVAQYDGIVIRSRFSIDASFLQCATNLKFIARVGAGLENIDLDYAQSRGIELIAAPEGNKNAVGEHTLGMLLALLNRFKKADRELKSGKWIREGNRGYELDGKVVGIIGYGNMGKSFAKKLRGFDVRVICYDIKDGVGDKNATQVSLSELFKHSDVVSLHTPQTPQTLRMVCADFINQFSKSFWFLNTARGKSVVTSDLVQALKSGKVLGAGLDVLEYEKSSFEHFFEAELPEDFQYLLNADNVILTPHIAGWTQESKVKLAQVIVDKIIQKFA